VSSVAFSWEHMPKALDCRSLLPLSAMQPAASRTALACGGAQITPYPPPLTAGCLAESGSRLQQSKSASIPRA
jgi:hypothetical protein